uniref:Homeobox protein cut-like n=1 Tax=Strigamia maritima TaxID=126957 RepID=T1IJV7_STRMM
MFMENRALDRFYPDQGQGRTCRRSHFEVRLREGDFYSERKLDTAATELANRQDESDSSRKKLVELSREFKKTTPEVSGADTRKVVAPLLKSFQLEIDNLTKRSKAAEAAFLNVYKRIIDLPVGVVRWGFANRIFIREALLFCDSAISLAEHPNHLPPPAIGAGGHERGWDVGGVEGWDLMPVLEYCMATQQKVQRLNDLEVENRQLKETLHEYNAEFKEVKNQEVTIKQLKEKIKEYEERLDAAVQIRIQEKESNLERQFATKERHLNESHKLATKKLGDTEQHVTNLQSALDISQSELFDLRSKYDEESHANAVDVMDHWFVYKLGRAALAEKEVAQLKEQLVAATHSLQLADKIQKAPDMEQTIDILTRSSLEVELAAKEKEISQLVDDVQRLQSTIKQMKETASAQIARLEEALEEKNRLVQQLEDKLLAQKDYDEIKRELRVKLKGNRLIRDLIWYLIRLHMSTYTKVDVIILHYSKHGADRPVVGASFEKQVHLHVLSRLLSLVTCGTGMRILKSIEFPESGQKPLEVLLVEKTKTLQTENTTLKGSNADVTGPSPLLGLATAPFPPPLQTVETFGSLLGEEIVSSWQRTLSPQETDSVGGAVTNGGSADGTTIDEAVTCEAHNGSPASNHASNANNSSATTPLPPPPPHSSSSTCISEDAKSQPLPQVGATTPGSTTPPAISLSNGVSPHESSQKDDAPKDMVESATLERLQEMLRHNIDKYANDCLNTLNISRRVRELLSIHNIGQRLFAKYILGLSQGTVSELLSKPKPWDKLTEKGRDSYRKMHAWACDDNCIYTLKALVPKKGSAVIWRTTTKNSAGFSGKEPGLPNFRQDDAATEERIAIILNEAQMAMKNHHHLALALDEKSNSEEGGKLDNCFSAGLQRRIRKYENDDIPQEMVTKIYQEELAKLMGKQPKDLAMLGPPFDFPKDQYLRTQEEIRLALNVYHQELSKLTQHHHMVMQNGVQDLSLPKDRERRQDSTATVKMRNGGDSIDNGMEMERPGSRERCCDSPQCHINDTLRHAGSAFTLVRPKTEPTDESSTTVCTAASPLQRMQSITNSLISQPSMPSMPTPPQRPLKAVLPPITQQQFDQYTNLNTEDIVKKVKEQLSQFSISQRLFGESVLGLSQGSVSDLLARPKPWHMLTQKGREPFIRMKIFLEDENAVHKLVASQYKIAPEKLMRTGSYGASPPTTSCKSHPLQKEYETAMKQTNNGTCNVHPITVNQVHLPTGPDMSRAPTPDAALKKVMGPRAMSHLQPSVYEMAALTQDLDTQLITTRIKETLLANNIGQKIFGEAVLGLSQGSVSELLSKPKPWHMLSIKGREPFIRMQLWLNDPHNVDRLQALKNERREANKRRRNNVDYCDGAESTEPPFVSGASTPLGHSPIGPAPKKPRVLFSEEQKEALRLAFALDPYPGTATIEFLAQELRLTARTITNWFHNHRMRLKQQAPHRNEEVAAAGNANSSSSNREASAPTFDPVQFRLLLNQRLLELQKEKGSALGPLGGFPFYDEASAQMSGLDLSLSSGPNQGHAHHHHHHHHHHHLNHEPHRSIKQENMDYEVDSIGSSEYNEDDSDSSSKGLPSACEAAMEVNAADRDRDRDVRNEKSSSRRKPAAPQWVNPGWGEIVADEDDERSESEDEAKRSASRKTAVIINGVCVRQTEEFDLPMSTEETVRVEPAPAPDHERGPQLHEREEDDEDDEEEEMVEESNERLAKIERLEKSLHENDERWDALDEPEERQMNIDKLQQRIEKSDDEEEWEF